jgi:hypothetical protein
MTPTNYIPEHLKLWKLPDSYFGAEWYDFYVFLGRCRDSKALSRANFDAALKRLAALPPWQGEDTSTYSRQAIRESHWAVGWVEWIAIHKDDTDALKLADEIKERMDGYPVVDEDLWQKYEDEEADNLWRCFSWRERLKYIRRHQSDFNFADWYDMLECVRGKFFGGEAGELLS